MIKALAGALGLLLLMSAFKVLAQDIEIPVAVIFADGEQQEVPPDHKVVFVRNDAPTVCIEVDFLELLMPQRRCAGLTVSPGCDR